MEKPNIHESAFVAREAYVAGNVSVGENCSIWFHATVRSEEEAIQIGAGSNIQDNAVVHVDGGYPVTIGTNVTVGHGAIVHGCTIGDNSLIGMGAIVLNGAKIGRNCIIGAGALIPQNMIVSEGSLVIGSPGKVTRTVTKDEITASRLNAERYVKEGQLYKQKERD